MQKESRQVFDESGLDPKRQGAWSLDLWQWRVHWSPRAQAIHDVVGKPSPTVWEALQFIDPDDRPRLVYETVRLIRHATPAPFRLEVGLTTAANRRRRVIIEAFRAGSDFDLPSIKGTIKDLAGAPIQAPGRFASESARGSDWNHLASALPHELKTPLGIARGLAEAVRDLETGLSAVGASRVQRIVHRLEQLDQTLDALMGFAKASSPIRADRVNVSRIAQSVLEELRDSEPAREVHWTIDPDLWVWGDEALLRIVAANLLRNAWKFTAGVPSSEIRVHAVPCGDGAAICVADNGIGFDDAQAWRLFVPFQRLHEPHEAPGTGLGLALVKQIVERHGGSIWAESSVGKGARFLFALPVNARRRSGAGRSRSQG